MSYQTKYNTEPLFFVSYIGTSNGAYIRAASHQQAKANFASGEKLLKRTVTADGYSTIYLQSKRISSY